MGVLLGLGGSHSLEYNPLPPPVALPELSADRDRLTTDQGLASHS